MNLALSHDELEALAETIAEIITPKIEAHMELPAPREWMDRAQCADYLGISVDHLDKLRRQGRIPEKWFSEKTVRFYRPAIDAAAQNNLRIVKDTA